MIRNRNIIIRLNPDTLINFFTILIPLSLKYNLPSEIISPFLLTTTAPIGNEP
jgi:hypothetical protein